MRSDKLCKVNFELKKFMGQYHSGGSRISRWWGGRRAVGGRRPPTWALFGENVWKTKELDPVGGGGGGEGACASGAPLIRQCITIKYVTHAFIDENSWLTNNIFIVEY